MMKILVWVSVFLPVGSSEPEIVDVLLPPLISVSGCDFKVLAVEGAGVCGRARVCEQEERGCLIDLSRLLVASMKAPHG